ncbi:protein phosphatase 2C 29-like isoform X2 [Pistacia vera]|uniref:protein phosphatase 2C 29-like isoform X2 n=1 Tax=Pistacia vera TaxID=55513 RepID=UPI0012630662|nr:protein phosphatase 2C 29-like isoform X2 [Pistacia vera]
MKTRNLVLLMLCVMVIAPIVLCTDRFSTSFKASSSRNQFLKIFQLFHLNLLPQVIDLNQSENEIKKSSGDAKDKIKASEQQNFDNDSQNMEIIRIKNEHPDDSQCIVNDRVKGCLKVTRAFGAGFLKKFPGYCFIQWCVLKTCSMISWHLGAAQVE